MNEETEVKRDSEWMKEEFKKLERTGVIDSWVYRDLWMMANQLDEPEVLSQEWISEHMYYVEGRDSSMVYVSDLQNLLVPKQEELESTIKVLIEAYKQEEDAHGELENGWISGFIKDLKNLVEEEPLYYALVKGHELVTDEGDIACKYWNLRVPTGDVLPSNRYSRRGEFVVKMSKSEWNELGINDSNADFVEVTE